jgi:hypothetical protein
MNKKAISDKEVLEIIKIILIIVMGVIIINALIPALFN